MPHTDAIVVMTTLASTDEAVKLVRALLERRLVACGTVLPAASLSSITGCCANGTPLDAAEDG